MVSSFWASSQWIASHVFALLTRLHTTIDSCISKYLKKQCSKNFLGKHIFPILKIQCHKCPVWQPSDCIMASIAVTRPTNGRSWPLQLQTTWHLGPHIFNASSASKSKQKFARAFLVTNRRWFGGESSSNKQSLACLMTFVTSNTDQCSPPSPPLVLGSSEVVLGVYLSLVPNIFINENVMIPRSLCNAKVESIIRHCALFPSHPARARARTICMRPCNG